MGTEKKYSNLIDIDSEWYRAEAFGIDGSPDDYILDKYNLAQVSMEWPGSNKDDFKISYREFSKLQSLLGFRDPFFKESRAVFNGAAGNYEGLLTQIAIAKFNFDWIYNYVDGNLSSKDLLKKLTKLESQSNKLHELLQNFTEHHRAIKIRKLSSGLSFSNQLNSDLENNEKTITSPDWTRYIEISGSLDFLQELIDDTRPIFSNSGGAPFKFSKPWLILEAVQIYEDWNVENLSAGISLDVDAGMPTGPFTRFLEQFFETFDPSYNNNSGLASTASKLLKSVKENNNLGMHRYLNPNLPSQKYMQALRVLKSNK